MRSAPWLTLTGGLLPLALGAALGSVEGNPNAESWAYPNPVWVFTIMAVGLALSHWFVSTGYLAVLRSTSGQAARYVAIGLAGTVVLGFCELWSGALARSNKDGDLVGALNIGYGASSVLIAVGSIGAGLLLRHTWRVVGLPLFAGGVFLVAVCLPLLAVGNDTAQVIVLSVWSLSYVWLGLALRRTTVLQQAPA